MKTLMKTLTITILVILAAGLGFGVQSQIEEHERQYQAERHRSHIHTLLLCIALVLVIIVTGASIRRLITRRRIKEKENEHLAISLESEKQQRELQQERAESSERQLVSNQLRMIEKEKMIDHLKGEITLRGDHDNIDPSLKRDLLNFISVHKASEESLNGFYEYFNQVHPTFFSSLKERCPSLTKSNLRLCAYLRIGLDNKQIAQILAIQPEAVKMARHRLRLKLGLDSASSLDDYILSI